MALVFDAATQSVRTDTSTTYAFTHTPVGTPRAVVVSVIHGVTSTGHVTDITYGGVAMTIKTEAADIVGKPGRSGFWFLGTGIPAGAQSVSVTLAATTDDMHFECLTFTAGADTEAFYVDSIDGDMANPARTDVRNGRTGIVVCSHYGGLATTGYTSNANQTRVATYDISTTGAFSALVDRQTDAGSADFTIGYTAATSDAAISAMTIGEMNAGGLYDDRWRARPSQFWSGTSTLGTKRSVYPEDARDGGRRDAVADNRSRT